ncbi:50S ribosomal protein L18 [Candidatus Micrarchaeota archaeon]|nr:50S ribosomal protein L18 [Candidatus Micrarchaeota archaeon]MBU1165935.1 50S ribosomal protein L18 [Candidatus Micrarchaeota archaeon]MBU1886839.1 50S ribosomal protein L18 [Candidatus Micrarchaeota archaeon]
MTRAIGPSFRVSFRRRYEGKTNFAKRLALIKSGKTRMVVRRSNKNIVVQFVDFYPNGDKTILTINGNHLAKTYKWQPKRNVWTAYLVGLMAGKLAQKKGIKEFVLDMGMYVPSKGSIFFAALKGAVDSGLKSKIDNDKVPGDKLTNPPDKYKSTFEDTKSKINSG